MSPTYPAKTHQSTRPNPLSKFINDHDARRQAVKEAVAAKHRNRIAWATEPYSPFNTVNS